MGLFSTSATLAPKTIEAAIIQKYRQQVTGIGLLTRNPVDTYLVESTEEGDTRGGFKFVDKGFGIPDYIQTIYKKATRTMHPYAAALRIEAAEAKVRPDLTRDRVLVAGAEWASFNDTLVYDMFKAKAGVVEEDFTAWYDTGADPVKNLSLIRALIGKETKSNYKPDTVIMGELAWHYLAVSAKIINQDYTPSGTDAYTITGKLRDVLGMTPIVTEAVGDDVYVIKAQDCAKWDEFLPETIVTYDGYQRQMPLILSEHQMYQWGEPSATRPEVIARLAGVGAVEPDAET